MKKVALSLAVIATLALVSCNNKAKNADTDTAKDSVEMTEPTMSDTDTTKDTTKDTATVKAETPAETTAETPAK